MAYMQPAVGPSNKVADSLAKLLSATHKSVITDDTLQINNQLKISKQIYNVWIL